ncbi:MAG: HD-GYP domain-containing protein, partial [Firmicutes bacterium]|nr:HD-GYP domain-containing protein [Bacillota bacterium]
DTYDKLTGLFNRAYFEKTFTRLDTVSSLPLSLVMGDIDGLELINNAFGYSTGDEMLVKVATIFKEAAREGDIVARYGADEFIILMPKANEEVLRETCEKIHKLCDSDQLFFIKPSISLGYMTKTKICQDYEQLIKDIEDKMYQHKLFQGKSIHSKILASFQKTLHVKNHEADDHARRMQDMVLKMAKKLGLSDSETDDLCLLAALHDIGKIGIPEEILKKPGKLSEAEWEAIKKHPEIGYKIARGIPETAHIAEAILHHHERWDGTGYPQGLRGTQIPFYSRIISIVDAFDVMTHERAYKRAYSAGQALDELVRCSGTQFQPELVLIFLELIKDLKNVQSWTA